MRSAEIARSTSSILRWWNGFDPLRDLKQTLSDFPVATQDGNTVAIGSSGSQDIEAMFKRLHYVLTEFRKEWLDQIGELQKVVVEGLQEVRIRVVAQLLGCDDPTLRSIKLLQACLTTSGVAPDTVAAIHDPLVELNNLRSTAGGAHRGSGGPTAYRKVHFENLVNDVANAMKLLAEQIELGKLNVP